MRAKTGQNPSLPNFMWHYQGDSPAASPAVILAVLQERVQEFESRSVNERLTKWLAADPTSSTPIQRRLERVSAW